jgi:hypothetical protein
MYPAQLLPMITSQCKVKVKLDTKNSYNYKKWLQATKMLNTTDLIKGIESNVDWVDKFNFRLKYTDGDSIQLKTIDASLLFDKKTIMVMTDQIKYTFSKGNYVINQQIPMIKLFMGIHMARKYIKYTKLNNNVIKFTFYLYQESTCAYDKEVYVYVDDRILVDQNNDPIVVNSISMLDHLLLKGLIKISNILDISIKDMNVNSLVGMCRGGKLYGMHIDKNIDIESMDFTIDDLMNDTSKNIAQKIEQCSWVSDNILSVLTGVEARPYNFYAAMIQDLYKNGMLLGITISNSYLYIITNMWTGQYGNLVLEFYNIFTGGTIKIDFVSVMHGMGQIGIIIKK